jgi:hypothetical protein
MTHTTTRDLINTSHVATKHNANSISAHKHCSCDRWDAGWREGVEYLPALLKKVKEQGLDSLDLKERSSYDRWSFIPRLVEQVKANGVASIVDEDDFERFDHWYSASLAGVKKSMQQHEEAMAAVRTKGPAGLSESEKVKLDKVRRPNQKQRKMAPARASFTDAQKATMYGIANQANGQPIQWIHHEQTLQDAQLTKEQAKGFLSKRKRRVGTKSGAWSEKEDDALGADLKRFRSATIVEATRTDMYGVLHQQPERNLTQITARQHTVIARGMTDAERIQFCTAVRDYIAKHNLADVEDVDFGKVRDTMGWEKQGRAPQQLWGAWKKFSGLYDTKRKRSEAVVQKEQLVVSEWLQQKCPDATTKESSYKTHMKALVREKFPKSDECTGTELRDGLQHRHSLHLVEVARQIMRNGGPAAMIARLAEKVRK